MKETGKMFQPLRRNMSHGTRTHFTDDFLPFRAYYYSSD